MITLFLASMVAIVSVMAVTTKVVTPTFNDHEIAGAVLGFTTDERILGAHSVEMTIPEGVIGDVQTILLLSMMDWVSLLRDEESSSAVLPVLCGKDGRWKTKLEELLQPNQVVVLLALGDVKYDVLSHLKYIQTSRY